MRTRAEAERIINESNPECDAAVAFEDFTDDEVRAEAAAIQPDEPAILYVNAYSVTRHWGGPEEGGWWYDSGEPLASVPMGATATPAEIDAEKVRLTGLIGWPRERQLGRYSTSGGDDFEIYVEEHPAAAFPETRPHYE